MTLSLYLGIAVAAFIALIVIRKRWSSGPATDTRSDVTKLVISADRRRQRRQSLERVVRNNLSP